MSWLWIAPAAAALIGAAVTAGLARRAADEVIGLRQDAHWLVEIGEEARRLRR